MACMSECLGNRIGVSYAFQQIVHILLSLIKRLNRRILDFLQAAGIFEKSYMNQQTVSRLINRKVSVC